MAWWLGMLETLYQKYAGVMLCWHSLGVLFVVFGIVIYVAGGGLFFGMPMPIFEALMWFLTVPWGLLVFTITFGSVVFGPNRSEMSQLSANAVVDLLKEVGGPLHYREIHQKLGEPPVTRNGEHAMGLLLLFRNDPRIYRPRWGTYGLVEWRERKPAAGADAVVALLKAAGEPLHYDEIRQKLEDRGLQLAGRGAAQAIRLLVQQDQRLYSLRWGTYGLTEWQGSIRTADADAVVALLKEVGEPLRDHEIHQKLKDLELWLPGGGGTLLALNFFVRQDPRLYSPRRDTYGLVEWRERKPAAGGDAVVALLREAGKPLHYREIDQKLDALGLRLAGGGAARAMNLLVQKNPRLYLLRWDTCGLVEWREGKPDGAQAAPANIGRPPRKPVSPTSRRREQPVQNSLPHTPLSGPLELAYEVLRAEGRPLHYAQLADRMLATGKWTTEAKSPSSTLNSYISKHISRHGDASPFFRASRGVYGLR